MTEPPAEAPAAPPPGLDLDIWEPDPDEPHSFRCAAWPYWHAWVGVSGLCYARRPRTSPPKVVRAATMQLLTKAVGRAEGGRWRWADAHEPLGAGSE